MSKITIKDRLLRILEDMNNKTDCVSAIDVKYYIMDMDEKKLEKYYKEAKKLVDGVDRRDSEYAIKFIFFNTILTNEDIFALFLLKELAQIQYGINDTEDSKVDLIGWLLLYERTIKTK